MRKTSTQMMKMEMKKMILMRRKMKVCEMSVSFISLMEVKTAKKFLWSSSRCDQLWLLTIVLTVLISVFARILNMHPKECNRLNNFASSSGNIVNPCNQNDNVESIFFFSLCT